MLIFIHYWTRNHQSVEQFLTSEDTLNQKTMTPTKCVYLQMTVQNWFVSTIISRCIRDPLHHFSEQRCSRFLMLSRFSFFSVPLTIEFIIIPFMHTLLNFLICEVGWSDWSIDWQDWLINLLINSSILSNRFLTIVFIIIIIITMSM